MISKSRPSFESLSTCTMACMMSITVTVALIPSLQKHIMLDKMI